MKSFPYFFGLLFLLFLLVPISSGLTVENPIYRGSLKAGDTDSLNMYLTPSPGETFTYQNIPITGDCSEWISLDKTSIKPILKTPITASIKIPTDAYSGSYQCEVSFIGPQNGMTQAAIAVPFKINVSGRPAPVVITTVATPTPTITTKAPIEDRIIPVLVPGVAEVKPVSGQAPQFPYIVIIAGLIAVFVIVLIYDYRRGKR